MVSPEKSFNGGLPNKVPTDIHYGVLHSRQLPLRTACDHLPPQADVINRLLPLLSSVDINTDQYISMHLPLFAQQILSDRLRKLDFGFPRQPPEGVPDFQPSLHRPLAFSPPDVFPSCLISLPLTDLRCLFPASVLLNNGGFHCNILVPNQL